MILPKVLKGPRKALFVWLVLNGFAQAALGLAAVKSFDHFLATGFTDGRLVAAIFLLAGGHFALRILQRRHGELFALDYVSETRLMLMQKLLSLPDNARNVRLGLVTARLGADLLALKTWLADGLATSIVMGIALAMLIAGAAYFYPPIALILAGVVAVWAVATLFLRPPLRAVIATARKLRGRLASTAGDLVMSRLTLAHFGRTTPALEALSRRGRSLNEALVRRATLSEALRAAPEWSLPVAALAGLVLLRDVSLSPAPLLLLLGMAGAQITRLSRAADLYFANAAAIAKLSSALEATSLAEGATDEKPVARRGVPVVFTLAMTAKDGAVQSTSVQPGAVVSLVGGTQSHRSDILAAAARLRDDMAIQAMVDGRSSANVPIRSWRKIVTLVSPRLPLIRASLGKNLAIGAPSTVTDDDVLDLARHMGIAGQPSDLETAVDPTLVPPATAIAMRLCRGLLRQSPVILLDESASVADLPAVGEFLKLARERQVAVISSGSVTGVDGKLLGDPIRVAP